MSSRVRPEILLVDDDALTTRSMQRYLTSRRPQWQVRTAANADAALQALTLHPADVCISDVNMGRTNGIDLLRAVALRWPQTIRILYCGGLPPDQEVPAAEVAHQIWLKTGEPETLVHAVDAALGAQSPIGEPLLWGLLAGSNHLPPAPSVFPQLERAVQKKATTAQDLTAIIAQDPAVAARVLQLASSAFLGLPSHVRSLEGAVGWLGLRTIRGLVLSVEVLQRFSTDLVPPLSVIALAQHAFRVAETSASIARDLAPQHTDLTYMAAVVHDLGVLVLGSRAPDRYQRVLAEARDTHMPLHLVEKRLLGVTHADVGASMLELWGLAPSLVQAVRHHHQRPTTHQWDSTGLLFLANQLVTAADEQPIEPLPAQWLDQIGPDLVEKWRVIAQR